MGKNFSDWGDPFEQDGEWQQEKRKNKHKFRAGKLCCQIICSGIIFATFFAMKNSHTELGDHFAAAADYSVSDTITRREVQEFAEPYLSRFAEVEIMQGFQTAAVRVMKPFSLLEKPAEWSAGDFDGKRRFYTAKEEAVKSVGSGKVVAIGDTGEEKSVAVEYGDNIVAEYGCLDEIYVKEGERVRFGQAVGIGRLDSKDGRAVFYLQVKQGGAFVDFEKLLGKSAEE
jgi:biotin carboxyl carrier protein